LEGNGINKENCNMNQTIKIIAKGIEKSESAMLKEIFKKRNEKRIR
jgi:hypothetical protein